MVILQGKSVFGGVAIGKIQFFKRDEIQIKRRHVDDPEAEIRRFRTAKEKALSELQQLYDKALTDVGEANAVSKILYYLLFLSYFFKYTITLRYGSSPSLLVDTYLSFCKVAWIILLS